MKKSDCNHCICKTCAIAYENSGAKGCGDCKECKEEKWDTVNSCPMYYNYEPPRVRKREENINE